MAAGCSYREFTGPARATLRRPLLSLLLSLNRFQEAIPLQEEEVAQFPEDQEAQHQLALLYYWQRDYRAATQIYQRLLEKAAQDAALRLEAAKSAEADSPASRLRDPNREKRPSPKRLLNPSR